MTDYDDILNLPHPVSARHVRMPIADRAAQFAPFAALTGYDAAIREVRRTTERRIELDEYELASLDEALHEALRCGPDGPEWEITWFRPDQTKSGGSYETLVGRVRRLDEAAGRLCLTSGDSLFLADIVALHPL